MLAALRHYLLLDFLYQLVMLRTTRRLLHIGLCAGLLCLAAPAYARRLITRTQADPDVIFVNESTQVTIKVQLTPGTKHGPTLKLFRRNGDGNDTRFLGLLYDDGTHGDSIAGDHIFVGQVTFDEKRLAKILLSIEVNGKRIEEDEDNDDKDDKHRDQDEGHKRRRPLPLSIDVVKRPTASSLQPILDAQQDATQLFDSLRTQIGDAAARSAVLKFLRRQPGVAKADISSDGVNISITYMNGLKGGIPTGPIGTRGTATKLTSSISRIPQSLSTLLLQSQSATTLACPESGIVLAPFYSGCANCFSPNDASEQVAQMLSSAGVSVTLKENDDVTIDVMKTLGQYGLVYVSSHGLEDDGQVILMTREAVNIGTVLAHFPDWFKNRIELEGNFWGISPDFVDYYADDVFPQSIVFIDACDTFGVNGNNNSLARAFLDNGASTYYGWRNTVNSNFAVQTDFLLYGALTNISNDPSLRSTGSVFDSIPNKIDPGSSHAEFMMAGNRNVVLGSCKTLPQWLGFTEGGPGVPGDGIFVNAGNQFAYHFSHPAPLGSFTDGFTLSVFPPSGRPAITSLNLTIIGNRPGSCSTSFGVGIDLAGTVTTNSIPGVHGNVPQSRMQEFVDIANFFTPGCGFTINDLYISDLSIPTIAPASPIKPGGTPFVIIAPSFLTTLDAAALGSGQNNTPPINQP